MSALALVVPFEELAPVVDDLREGSSPGVLWHAPEPAEPFRRMIEADRWREIASLELGET